VDADLQQAAVVVGPDVLGRDVLRERELPAELAGARLADHRAVANEP
jgi:hypothetical protein